MKVRRGAGLFRLLLRAIAICAMSVFALAIVAIAALFITVRVRDYLPPRDPYVAALQNGSTAPNYVLITVVNDRTRERRTICTEAPFLIGALQMERHIPYGGPEERMLEKEVLANRERVFHFSRPDALKNVQPRYTQAVLAAVQARLGHMSGIQLTRDFKSGSGEIEGILNGKTGWAISHDSSAIRDAVAHVMLEKGLLPGRGCVAGYLTLTTQGDLDKMVRQQEALLRLQSDER